MHIQLTSILIVLSQNICCPTCFSWSYPSLGHPYTKEFWLLVFKICKFKIFVQDNTNLHT